ncbi:hypothetical protein ASF62_10905 [Leifsonia sp. Leaf325]|nr:hypothetical protein [Leifsonia sp. Leaf325]KQQ94570.1 hypothetical protein ASF62_10905 [Leifsonia sp. Leaf325]
MIHVGDFDRSAVDPELETFADTLQHLGLTFYFVLGHDEIFDSWRLVPAKGDGIRWLHRRIGNLPRGFRVTLSSGKTLAALGGGGSYDRTRKQRLGIWSADEMITEDDITRLGTEHADILIGHEAPSGLLALDALLESTQNRWTDDDIQYHADQRDLFTQGFLHVTPNLHVGGHYHRHVDQVLGWWDPEERRPFVCRSVLLDRTDGAEASTAILDVETMGMVLFNSDGDQLPAPPEQVTDLTMQTSGRWRVTSVGSVHSFDLDSRTWSRVPGPEADFLDYAPAERPLRTLDRCELGRSGFWTMPDDYVGPSWHRSSVVRLIERMPEKEGIDHVPG